MTPYPDNGGKEQFFPRLRRWKEGCEPHVFQPEDSTAGRALRRGLAWYLGGLAVALLPAGVTAYMAFRTGAYYAETYAGIRHRSATASDGA